MKRVTSIAVFAAVLCVALVCMSLIDIYVFGHFDGAIGNRVDNLKVSAFLSASITLMTAFGFGAALFWKHVLSLPILYSRVGVPFSAAIACVLIYAIELVGPLASSLFGSWYIGFVAAYCFLVGALLAVSLVGVLKRYAA